MGGGGAGISEFLFTNPYFFFFLGFGWVGGGRKVSVSDFFYYESKGS